MSDLVAFSGELYLLSAVSIVPFILPTCLSGTYLLNLSLVINTTLTSLVCQTLWLFQVSCIYFLSCQSCHLYFQPVSQEPTFWVFHQWSIQHKLVFCVEPRGFFRWVVFTFCCVKCAIYTSNLSLRTYLLSLSPVIDTTERLQSASWYFLGVANVFYSTTIFGT